MELFLKDFSGLEEDAFLYWLCGELSFVRFYWKMGTGMLCGATLEGGKEGDIKSGLQL